MNSSEANNLLDDITGYTPQELEYGMTDEANEQVYEMLYDPYIYIQAFLKIQDKLGRLTDLVFNDTQKKLLEAIQRQEEAGKPVRLIILKARQMGISTAVAGLFYHKTTSQQNVNSMIVAHKADASTAIFDKCKMFYDNLAPMLQPLRKASNAKELLFENPSPNPKTKREMPGLRSKIEIETAVNKDAGRSKTIHNLHISELAFWPYPGETLASLMQAVPNQPGTTVIIESTANGVGNVFYTEVKKAQRGESVFELLFFPWYEEKEYTMPVPDDFIADDEEKELKELYNLTDGQIVWRRWCISANCQGSVDIFHQEYPSTPDEAFIASGRPVFNTNELDRALTLCNEPVKQGRIVQDGNIAIFKTLNRGYLKIWEMPKDGEDYVIGADVAAGTVGGDYSCAEVINARTKEQVAEWHGHIEPDLFGEELALLGYFYNTAYIVPEANSFGVGTIKAMRSKRHYPKIHRRRTLNKDTNKVTHDYGFYTSSATKELLITGLSAYLREGANRVHSRDAISECLTYARDDKGHANAQSGCFDDRVISLALAVYGADNREHSAIKYEASKIDDLYRVNKATGY